MNLIIFVVALSILVLVHELGHFLAAKKVGIKVEEFGLGLPPRIVGKKIGETVFSLNWLPIGGFCKLYGEDPTSDEAKANKNRTFISKSPGQKALVVLGGVAMNLLLALVIFSVVYAIMGVPKATDRVLVTGVVPDSPAAEAGLEENDWIKGVAGQRVNTPEQLTKEVTEYRGETTKLTIERNGQEKIVEVAVRDNPPAGEGAMGIAISNIEMVKVPWYRLYEGVWAGFQEAYFWGKVIGEGVIKMIGGLFSGQVPKDVAGPIGMFEATSSIRQNQGMLAVIHFFGIIAVNLAVVNVLPFPALDGGRILFVGYEWIFKKKADERVEAIVNNVGMMILLALILVITVSDVVRIWGRG